jgi:peptidoglycan biosynthesis protein MviN/MurJ (putative lipid II flippase)
MKHFLLVPIGVDATVLRELLLFLDPEMVIFTMRDIVSHAFLALQDTKTPMVVGLVAVGSI